MLKKVLFVGGGRRVELAKLFLSRNYAVTAYEISKNVPIASVANIIRGKEWYSEETYYQLKESYDVYDLILPLHDGAITLLSTLADDVSSANIVVSGHIASNIACNKREFQKYMLKFFPELYPDPKDWDGKFILKPNFGFGSRNIIYSDMPVTKRGYVTQAFVEGKEYSVDAYFSPDTGYVDSVPRERIRVAGGEVLTSLTERNTTLQTIVKTIGDKLKIFGPANFQFILNKDGIYCIEINARFGGGFTFSMKAGFDVISMLERDYLSSDSYNYIENSWMNNVLLERSYRDHLFYLEDN